MEPENNTVPTPVATPATTPAPEQNMMAQGVNAKKKGKGALCGMIILGILAVGGIGFGVWTMMDGKAQKETLNEQIDALKQQNDELQEKLSSVANSDSDIASMATQQNPIIIAPGSDIYNVTYDMPVFIEGNDNNPSLIFSTLNGKFSKCYAVNIDDDCSVSGLPEGVYKMANIYEGNGVGGERIGFLMNDGSVYYAPIYNGLSSINTELVVRKADIDGFVKDILTIDYCNTDNHYCNRSTVFVMSDNSLIKYDESMFK